MVVRALLVILAVVPVIALADRGIVVVQEAPDLCESGFREVTDSEGRFLRCECSGYVVNGQCVNDPPADLLDNIGGAYCEIFPCIRVTPLPLPAPRPRNCEIAITDGEVTSFTSCSDGLEFCSEAASQEYEECKDTARARARELCKDGHWGSGVSEPIEVPDTPLERRVGNLVRDAYLIFPCLESWTGGPDTGFALGGIGRGDIPGGPLFEECNRDMNSSFDSCYERFKSECPAGCSSEERSELRLLPRPAIPTTSSEMILQSLYDRRGEGAVYLNALGYSLLDEGMLGEAIQVFRLNAELYPHSARVLHSLGEAYEVADRPRRAARVYESVLAIDPDHDPAVDSLERIRRSSRY